MRQVLVLASDRPGGPSAMSTLELSAGCYRAVTEGATKMHCEALLAERPPYMPELLRFAEACRYDQRCRATQRVLEC